MPTVVVLLQHHQENRVSVRIYLLRVEAFRYTERHKTLVDAKKTFVDC